MANLTKSEVEQIVDDEIKKFIDKKLDIEVSKYINRTGSKSHESTNELVKNGIDKLVQYLYIQNNLIQNYLQPRCCQDVKKRFLRLKIF